MQASRARTSTFSLAAEVPLWHEIRNSEKNFNPRKRVWKSQNSTLPIQVFAIGS